MFVCWIHMVADFFITWCQTHPIAQVNDQKVRNRKCQKIQSRHAMTCTSSTIIHRHSLGGTTTLPCCALNIAIVITNKQYSSLVVWWFCLNRDVISAAKHEVININFVCRFIIRCVWHVILPEVYDNQQWSLDWCAKNIYAQLAAKHVFVSVPASANPVIFVI